MKKESNHGKPTDEKTAWMNARQSRLTINKTTITPGGQILDWIPIESQTKDAIASPPVIGEGDVSPVDPAKPTHPIVVDIGEAGPEGHVPILRPDLSRMPNSMELKDFLSKRGGLKVNVNRRNKNPADPTPFGYFHAFSIQTVQAYGCDGLLNLWDPKINIPAPPTPDLDHSISQTWLQNMETGQTHSIEAGWTVDLGLNANLYPHLFIYYTNNNYQQDGDNLGGYNRMYSGWVQTHPTIFPGLQLSTGSTHAIQVELGIKYRLIGGNWWFAIKFVATEPWTYIGYYPSSLFPGGLANYVETVAFGGEVYSSLANPCDTLDQMGNGVQAFESYREVAYQRNLHYSPNLEAILAKFDGIPQVDAAGDCAHNNYTISCFMGGNSFWESYQYYGGPVSIFSKKIPPRGL